ncbi:MAG: hypothetical protein PHS14_16545 [Elusimicrobia bacterium]|nr:hypothetical protein [Elusimicrobiota bacterium]
MKTTRMVKFTIPLPPRVLRALERDAKRAGMGPRAYAREILMYELPSLARIPQRLAE